MAKATKILARNLAFYRKNRGLSQGALATMANISKQTISNLENERQPFTSTLVGTLANALRIQESDLLDSKIPHPTIPEHDLDECYRRLGDLVKKNRPRHRD